MLAVLKYLHLDTTVGASFACVQVRSQLNEFTASKCNHGGDRHSWGFFSEQLGCSAGNLVPGVDLHTGVKTLLPEGF